MFDRIFRSIAYRPESRKCFNCGVSFTTNSYKHETNCESCKKKREKKEMMKENDKKN